MSEIKEVIIERKQEKNTCWDCGYCRNIVYNTHISCSRKWVAQVTATVGSGQKSTVFNAYIGPDKKKVVLRSNQWSRAFPYNFDPIWLRGCEGWAKEINPELQEEETPLTQLFGILGRRI